jgi:hypothetical protein
MTAATPLSVVDTLFPCELFSCACAVMCHSQSWTLHAFVAFSNPLSGDEPVGVASVDVSALVGKSGVSQQLLFSLRNPSSDSCGELVVSVTAVGASVLASSLEPGAAAARKAPAAGIHGRPRLNVQASLLMRSMPVIEGNAVLVRFAPPWPPGGGPSLSGPELPAVLPTGTGGRSEPVVEPPVLTVRVRPELLEKCPPLSCDALCTDPTVVYPGQDSDLAAAAAVAEELLASRIPLAAADVERSCPAGVLPSPSSVVYKVTCLWYSS